MFLNRKLPQNKTCSISDSGRRLISDRTSRSLLENKKSTVAHIIANVYGVFVYTVGHSESIR